MSSMIVLTQTYSRRFFLGSCGTVDTEWPLLTIKNVGLKLVISNFVEHLFNEGNKSAGNGHFLKNCFDFLFKHAW